MIIMALDHVRDLIHIDSINQSPTNLETTTSFLFFTRWITYLCAPIFVFLAGSSAFLSLEANKNYQASKKLLLKRGIWLIFLEFTIVNFGLYFDVGFHTLLFEVIASTGLGFVVLSLLLNKSLKLLAAIGLSILLLHNLTPIIPFGEHAIIKAILTPLFSPTAIPLFSGRIFIVGYPAIPWLGIMLLGFAAGNIFNKQQLKNDNQFLKIGLISISLFFVLRFINIYGDGNRWLIQKDASRTILSFFNISKYPPSLDFCLITIGIMFLLLAISEKLPSIIKKVALTYGRVPLFYFILHFYLVHIILLFVLLLQGFHWSQLEFATGTFGRPAGQISGLPLGYIYLIWILVVAMLYLPCTWYGNFKATKAHWWLKYL